MFQFDFLKFSLSFLTFSRKVIIAYWRSLLILLIGVYLPLQVFGWLAVEVWRNEGGFPWDIPILVAIHRSTGAQLDLFAIKLTKLGSFWSVIPFASAIALRLFIQKRWRSLVYLLTTLLGNVIINRTAKLVIHRLRPDLWHSPAPEFDYSFPSGHAMTSMTLVAALVILTWGKPWCWLITTIGSFFVLGIGWTRLYLGVHFPSDILAGWMISIAWVIGVNWLIKAHSMQSSSTNDEEALNETSLLSEEIYSANED